MLFYKAVYGNLNEINDLLYSARFYMSNSGVEHLFFVVNYVETGMNVIAIYRHHGKV